MPILVADLNDKDSMFKLASSTKVLLSTAGPYSQLGTPVIRACIQAKTHYADINGEHSGIGYDCTSLSCFIYLFCWQTTNAFPLNDRGKVVSVTSLQEN